MPGAQAPGKHVDESPQRYLSAKALGLTFQRVQKYEKGMNRIGSSRMAQIAEALGVEPAYFYEGVGPTFGEDAASASVNRFLASKDGMRLAQASHSQMLLIRTKCGDRLTFDPR